MPESRCWGYRDGVAAAVSVEGSGEESRVSPRIRRDACADPGFAIARGHPELAARLPANPPCSLPLTVNPPGSAKYNVRGQ